MVHVDITDQLAITLDQICLFFSVLIFQGAFILVIFCPYFVTSYNSYNLFEKLWFIWQLCFSLKLSNYESNIAIWSFMKQSKKEFREN